VNIIGTVLKLIFGCCKIKLKEAKVKDTKRFDYKVLEPEMEDEIELTEILKEHKWFKDAKGLELANKKAHLFRSRLNNVSQTTDELASLQFTTLASYNYRVRKGVILDEPWVHQLFLQKL
jgi:hypothetical protein